MANEAIASSMDFFSTRSAVALFSSEEDIIISLFYSLSSQRVFLSLLGAFFFFFQNDEFFLEREVKKEEEFVSLKNSCWSLFCLFSLFFLMLFVFCFFLLSKSCFFSLLFYLSAPSLPLTLLKKSRTLFSRNTQKRPFFFYVTFFKNLRTFSVCCALCSSVAREYERGTRRRL
jgi:hypothetical protein